MNNLLLIGDVMLEESKFPPEINRALDALGQKNRRKIISFIIDKKKMSFSDLIEHINLNSSTLNFHLKELMKASLIKNFYRKSENPGRKYSYYELTDFGKDFCKALGIK